MAFEVFLTEKKDGEKLRQALNDDIVSRQSIYLKDGKLYGQKDGTEIAIVEGSDAGLAKAKTLITAFGKLADAKEKETIYKAVKADEEASIEGMGAIFG